MAYSHYINAQILSRSQRIEQALRELRVAILLDPHAPELRARQVELYVASGDTRRASEALAVLRTEYRCNPEEDQIARDLSKCLQAWASERSTVPGEQTCSNKIAEAAPELKGSGG